MSLNENIKICELIDFYGALLTLHQSSVLKSYYFNNLSLVEIAANEKVSKQAVSDILRRSRQQLEKIDSCLNLSKLSESAKQEIIMAAALNKRSK